nr:glycosyltransferase family 2 protein [uncultured Carboxylicivirga sp.]
MNSSPKISIITVCFNSEKYIEECILSVINQSYTNKEYIIIDGCSTDNTLQIIDKYKEHIHYFISEPDKGISDAFNKGIKVATGDLIGILNSDDFMNPEALKKIASHYTPEVDIYRGHSITWDEKLGRKFTSYPNDKFRLIPFEPRICHESAYITKKAYENYGLYKVDLKYMMDLDLFIRMYNNGIRSKFIDVSVITFRIGGASSTSEKFLTEERRRIILENGGTKFQSFIYINYFRVRYMAKQFMDFISGDIKYKLKYK